MNIKANETMTTAKQTHFIYNKHVVKDITTGLVWQREVPDGNFSLEEAKDYARELRLGGLTDWRVPTKEELESIVDRAKFNPAIDIEVFPNTPSSHFWTCSPSAYSSHSAWIVNFSLGSSYNDVNGYSRVRCVR